VRKSIFTVPSELDVNQYDIAPLQDF